MHGFGNEGDYYFIKIYAGAELSLDCSINISLVSATEVFKYHMTLDMEKSLLITLDSKYEMVTTKTEITELSTKVKMSRLEETEKSVQEVTTTIEAKKTSTEAITENEKTDGILLEVAESQIDKNKKCTYTEDLIMEIINESTQTRKKYKHVTDLVTNVDNKRAETIKTHEINAAIKVDVNIDSKSVSEMSSETIGLSTEINGTKIVTGDLVLL